MEFGQITESVLVIFPLYDKYIEKFAGLKGWHDSEIYRIN